MVDFRANEVTERFHILVVDDDQDLRNTLSDLLDQVGYSVAVAQDGLDALSQLRAGTRRPGLILLDLQMPNMNGVEFRGEQLKAAELANIPVAILTADTEGKQKAASLNAIAFLCKPLKFPQLLTLISDIRTRREGSQ